MRRPLAALLRGLPRVWVAALLVVAALDLAVVATATGGRTAEAATAIAPLVTRLAPGPLVVDGALVADDVALVAEAHALVVDGTAEAATVSVPGGHDALVLAADGVALLVSGDRWTVAYAGSLSPADLHALLAGWEEAQRGTAVLAAVLTGALTAALATAVLALGVRHGGRLAGSRRASGAPTLPPRDALAWWAVSLAAASTGAAAVVLGTGGAVGGTPTLVATLVAATVGVCALAATSARAAPRATVPGPTTPAPETRPDPPAVPADPAPTAAP